MTYAKGARGALKTILLGATVLSAGFTAGAYAQDAAASKDDSTVVVVTGYRASLQSATKAKKDATNFTESIFAEDMGKFPDLNMAEAMQRVPGMIVQRDGMTGEGTQISVRALPSSFTLVTMNGSRVAVASDFGFSGNTQPNRQVDLDMFPTELFSRVDVSKTPSADTLEGGIAGSVNMQNSRPFDHKGPHLVLSAQDSYNLNAHAASPRFAVVASNTWDKFGALVGFTYSKKNIFSDGFESLAWSDPNMGAFAGCNTTPTCDPGISYSGTTVTNPNGLNGFRFNPTVQSYTGNGLTPGTVLSQNDLLALNPGLTADQLKGALLPRLARNYLLDGTSENKIGLIALEYRPSDDLRFHLDIFGGGAERQALRTDMNWIVRNSAPNDGYNNGMIPLNMTVDANDVVTSGTFADSAFLSEANEYHDKTAMGSATLGFDWKINDALTWNGEAAVMHSTYQRFVTFMKFTTPVGADTVTYTNNGSDMPTVKPSLDLNDPSIAWRYNLFQLQEDSRSVTSKSVHTNLTWNLADSLKFKGGYAYDEDSRTINVTDNSTAFQNAFAGLFGVATPGAIPAGAISQYLMPMNVSHYMDGVSGAGYTNFIIPNWDKISAAVNYDALAKARGGVTLSTTYNNAGASNIDEKISASYLMAYTNNAIGGVTLKTNFGLRFQNTDQVITSPNNINSKIVMITTEHRYHDVLPSFNAVANVTDHLNLRFAASKTMTRANPSQMSSQLNFGDTSAQSASEGNPALKPYYSKNLDIGGEYYTGKTGYVGLTFFSKTIKDFIANSATRVPFTALGLDYANISQQQQIAIASYLNTTVAAISADPSLLAGMPINLTQPFNVQNPLKLTGAEFMWVQPLDFVTPGLGYTFNYTKFHVSNLGLMQGVPDDTYNFTAYYEHGPFSTHISYAYVGQSVVGGINTNYSLPYLQYQQDRHQIDLSASYKFKAFGFEQSITLDGINLDKQGYRQYFGSRNIPYTYNNPGATVLLGWRANF